MVDPVGGERTQQLGDLSRREAIARAIFLVAGIIVAPAACSRPDNGGFFTSSQLRILEELCETVVPQTDTPGARATNVHGFIDGMMKTWASKARQKQFQDLLARIDALARGRFTDLSSADRSALVQGFDAAAFVAKDEAWIQLKKLILLGYYSSEAGATMELAYLPVPGDWRPDVPIGPATRTWAE